MTRCTAAHRVWAELLYGGGAQSPFGRPHTQSQRPNQGRHMGLPLRLISTAVDVIPLTPFPKGELDTRGQSPWNSALRVIRNWKGVGCDKDTPFQSTTHIACGIFGFFIPILPSNLKCHIWSLGDLPASTGTLPISFRRQNLPWLENCLQFCEPSNCGIIML